MRPDSLIILFATSRGFSPRTRIIGSFPTAPQSKITSGTPVLQHEATPQSMVRIPGGSCALSNEQISKNNSSSSAIVSGDYRIVAALRMSGSNFIAVSTILAT